MSLTAAIVKTGGEIRGHSHSKSVASTARLRARPSDARKPQANDYSALPPNERKNEMTMLVTPPLPDALPGIGEDTGNVEEIHAASEEIIGAGRK